MRHSIFVVTLLAFGFGNLGAALAFAPQSPQRAAAKFTKAAKFASQRPAMMSEMHEALAKPKLDQKTGVAAIVSIMDQLNLRVGSEKYSHRAEKDIKLPSGRVIHQQPSYAASSLLKSHVTFQKDGTAKLEFDGKERVHWGGKDDPRIVKDPSVVRALKLFAQQRGTDRLFATVEGGKAVPITERTVRGAFAKYDATPKMLRTVQANDLLGKALASRPKPTTKAQAEKQLGDAIKEVAKQMGHTAAVCRSNYLNPKTLAAYVVVR